MKLRFALSIVLLPFAGWSEERPLSALIESVTAGVFCPDDFMPSVPAPMTERGTIYTPAAEPVITWQTREVPARHGLAFGITLKQAEGPLLQGLEVKVTRPRETGGISVERWPAWIGDAGTTTNFWVFDDPDEIAEGNWRFEISRGPEKLADVTFVVMNPSDIKGPVPDCVLTLS